VVLFELVLYVQYHKTKQTHSKYCIFIDISYKYTTEKKRKIILKFELLDAGTPPAPSSSAIMGKAKKDRAAKRGADGGGSAASSKTNTPSKKAKVRERAESPDADSTGNATATASDEEPTEVATGKQVSAPFFVAIYCFQIKILTISACCSPSRMHWTSSRTFSRAFSRPCRRRRRPSTSSPVSLPLVVGGVAVRLRRQLLGRLAVTVMTTAPTAAGTSSQRSVVCLTVIPGICQRRR